MKLLRHNTVPGSLTGNGNVLVEPSRELLGEIQMARRRGQQKGHVHKQGSVWYLAFREDALDDNGKLVRVRRNPRIADGKEISKREAQRLAR